MPEKCQREDMNEYRQMDFVNGCQRVSTLMAIWIMLIFNTKLNINGVIAKYSGFEQKWPLFLRRRRSRKAAVDDEDSVNLSGKS